MGMKYTQVAADAFETLQMNAGIVLSEFNPAIATVDSEKILGVTTGGLQFASNPEFVDFAEDMDNVPNNTAQFKQLTSYSPTISGTFVTLSVATAQRLVGTSTLTTESGLIVPKTKIDIADFVDLWFVGDYSDKNGATNGGFIAIHLLKAYSTGGFQWQTTKDGKGQFAFELSGHYDVNNIETAPFELYVRAGSAEPTTGA